MDPCRTDMQKIKKKTTGITESPKSELIKMVNFCQKPRTTARWIDSSYEISTGQYHSLSGFI